MQKLFNNFFVVYLRNREKTKINPLSLLGTYKTTTNDITISICSDSHYYWRTFGRHRTRCHGRSRIGNTHVRFWFTTHRTTYRRYVDDCRRHFRCLLYASSRRAGLYGETGRTFATQKSFTRHTAQPIGDLPVHLYCRNRACGLFRIARNCRGSYRNKDSSGTPARYCCDCFATGYYSQSHLCRYGSSARVTGRFRHYIIRYS